MKMISKSLNLLTFLLILTITSCAMFSASLDTNEKKYLVARTELNLLLEQYIGIQDRISDSDHERFKEAFKSADLALDTWESFLSDSSYNYTADLNTWLKTKTLIIDYLRNF